LYAISLQGSLKWKIVGVLSIPSIGLDGSIYMFGNYYLYSIRDPTKLYDPTYFPYTLLSPPTPIQKMLYLNFGGGGNYLFLDGSDNLYITSAGSSVAYFQPDQLPLLASHCLDFYMVKTPENKLYAFYVSYDLSGSDNQLFFSNDAGSVEPVFHPVSLMLGYTNISKVIIDNYKIYDLYYITTDGYLVVGTYSDEGGYAIPTYTAAYYFNCESITLTSDYISEYVSTDTYAFFITKNGLLKSWNASRPIELPILLSTNLLYGYHSVSLSLLYQSTQLYFSLFVSDLSGYVWQTYFENTVPTELFFTQVANIENIKQVSSSVNILYVLDNNGTSYNLDTSTHNQFPSLNPNEFKYFYYSPYNNGSLIYIDIRFNIYLVNFSSSSLTIIQNPIPLAFNNIIGICMSSKGYIMIYVNDGLFFTDTYVKNPSSTGKYIWNKIPFQIAAYTGFTGAITFDDEYCVYFDNRNQQCLFAAPVINGDYVNLDFVLVRSSSTVQSFFYFTGYILFFLNTGILYFYSLREDKITVVPNNIDFHLGIPKYLFYDKKSMILSLSYGYSVFDPLNPTLYLQFVQDSLLPGGGESEIITDGSIGYFKAASTIYSTTSFTGSSNNYWKPNYFNGVITLPTDPIVPNAPSTPIVSYTPGNNYVDLSWNDGSNNGSPITSYTIYYQPSAALFGSETASSSSYRLNNLNYGMYYKFRVSATNANGQGPLSSYSPPPPLPPIYVQGIPTPPTNVLVVPTPGSPLSGTLTWLAPTPLLGSLLSNYYIRVYANGIIIYPLNTNSLNLSYTINDLSYDIQYEFAVAAMTNAGMTDYSLLSNLFLLPAIVPAAPTNFSASSAPGSTTALLTWTAARPHNSPLTSYILSRNLPDMSYSITTGLTASNLSFSIPDLSYNTSYQFQVYATNGIGAGPTASINSFRLTNSAPAAPTQVSASSVPGSTYASVFFVPGSDHGSPITSYTVSTIPTGGDISGSVSPVSYGPLSFDISYQFLVKATNALGPGPNSVPSAPFRLTAAPPSAPTGLTASSTNGSATAHVSWTAPANNNGSQITGYRIDLVPSIGQPFSRNVLGTTYDISLNFDIIYSMSVVALSTAGPSPASDSLNDFSLYGPPLAPYGLVAILYPASTPAVQLFWNAPPSNHGSTLNEYQINISVGGVAQTPYRTGLLQTSLVLAYLRYSTVYRFSVVALSNNGSSPASNAYSITVMPTPPYTPPTNVQVETVPGQNRASVFWNEPTSSGGSTITSHTLYLTNVATGETTTFGPL